MPTPAGLVTGARLGPYEVLGLLGAGGMGEVYRARDPRLGREVAIKVVASGLAQDEQARRRFEREARAVAALSHPNILAIHDVGDQDGRLFAVTELLTGETLRERLARGPLPWRKALETGAEVAAGLAAAHARGLVHRDLKPANVFLAEGGRVKILDFGLAKLREPDPEAVTLSGTMPGTLLGTISYMSPEQAAGKPVDARSDLFALGCVLYEMLSGRRAFARPTAAGTLAAILAEDPPALGDDPATPLPTEVVSLVEHCLAKDPEARFQSAQDVAITLRWLGGAPSLSSGERSRGARRRWQAAPRALLAAAALVALGAALGRLAESRLAEPPPVPRDIAQLTYDQGYTAEPALSPDGSLAAYASDRAGAGNLDIWVHHVGGGSPIRLTSDPADERQPSFSPDGARIVFRSERDGGGLYSMPVLGGEPRLLVSGGYDPRWSPDGRSIAYWAGPFVGFSSTPGVYRTFIVPASGGSAREIPGFTGARFPAWSPDGAFLVLVGSRSQPADPATWDWWAVPVDGTRSAVAAGVAPPLAEAGVAMGPDVRPAGWLGDEVIFGAGRDLWALSLPAGGRAGRARPLTFGPGRALAPALTGSGLVAFVSSTSAHKLWSLPLDAEAGRVLGPPTRLTPGVESQGRASSSADGATLAFLEFSAHSRVMVGDLGSGRVRDLGLSGRFGPVLSRDGTRVAVPDENLTGWVVPVGGGEPRKVCESCLVGDWLSDGRHLITVEGPGQGAAIRLVDVESGAGRDLVRPPTGVVNRPHLSPDDRWLAFRASTEPASPSIFLVPLPLGDPAPPSQWTALTEPERDSRPCGWSPSGRLLYFVSSRDGFRCLYALPVDPTSGRPRGPARIVHHLHNLRGAGGGGASVISTGAGNAVLADRILLDYPIETANVWTLRIGGAGPVGSDGEPLSQER